MKTRLLLAAALTLLCSEARAQISNFTLDNAPSNTDFLPTVHTNCAGQVGCNYRVTIGTLGAHILNEPTIQQPLIQGVTLPSALFGNIGDATYGPNQIIVPVSGLAIRSPVSGCGDQGSAFSAITGWQITSAAQGIATHSAPCQNTLPLIAAGGNFDSVAVSLQNGGGYPLLQPTLASTPYDATHVYFSPALTSAQQALLPPNTFVLTNSIDGSGNPFGSYITSIASNGSSATVVGWAALGTNNATTGQVPSTTYKSGTGSSPQTYLGSAVNLFGENAVCGNTTWPMLVSTQCYEVDVVPVSGGSGAVYGMVFEALGNTSAATGIIFPANTYPFNIDITILGIANSGFGIDIAPPYGTTGVGMNIYMQTGTPMIVQCATGGTSCNGQGNAFTIDGVGDVMAAGNLTVYGGITVESGAVFASNASFSGTVNVGGNLGLSTRTVATLGTCPSAPVMSYASNGRKPGEGAGSGTGVPVICTLSSGTWTWFSYFSGAAVAS